MFIFYICSLEISNSVLSLLGLGNNDLAHFVERSRYLSPENIVYIGLRDVE